MSKRKRQRNQTPKAQVPGFRIPMANPTVIDVQKIKDDATKEAVRILQEQVKLTQEECERIRKQAYDKGMADAMRYFMINGCKALNNKYRFAYVRLERFIDETMRLVQEGDIEETQKWLAKIGFTFNFDEAEKEDKGDTN